MGRVRERQAQCLEQSEEGGRHRRDEGAGVRESWTMYGLEATEKLEVESEKASLSLSTAVMEGGRERKGTEQVRASWPRAPPSSGGSLCPEQADGGQSRAEWRVTTMQDGDGSKVLSLSPALGA